ncbi:hypothetical protein GCM10009422_21630 [Brevundimonas kwangchunensis]|uniref:DUF2971 domain-containing protein n=1 Tax=Brevundimonas kwangchunensis TaxID=322163 RepID=A0ABN1GZT9_9CAUL
MTKLTGFVRRYTSISAVVHMLRKQELHLLDPQSWDDRNDRYFMALYKEARGAGGLYGLCAAQCSETYHHWRVFTGTADGACVELNRTLMEDALSKLEGIRFGEVDYLKLQEATKLTARDVDRLPFVKREGFKAEEEYRVIAETRERQQPALGIPMPIRWVNAVYLNPWLPQPIADSVKATLRELPGCSKLRVVRSQLIDSGRWKQAGDIVAGKPRQPARPTLKPKA